MQFGVVVRTAWPAENGEDGPSLKVEGRAATLWTYASSSPGEVVRTPAPALHSDSDRKEASTNSTVSALPMLSAHAVSFSLLLGVRIASRKSCPAFVSREYESLHPRPVWNS